MGERSRFSLPSLGVIAQSTGAPNVDEARAALGGRVSTETGGVGACVRVTMKRGAAAIGVLVCVHQGERDVWIGDGRFARVAAGDIAILVDELPELAAVAASARAFAVMKEGDEVSYSDRRGTKHTGTLVEKCRYGGLLKSADEKITAISFRRLTAV